MTARPWRLVAAGCAGGAMASSLPPTDMWPLAVVGVALLAVAVRGTRAAAAAGYGLLTGAVCFAIALRWITVVGVDAWVGLTLFTALPIAATAAAMALVMRLPGWPWLIGAVWVAQEAVRGRVPLGGWPWGRLAFGQVEAGWLPLAHYGGAAVLSFAVAASGGWLAWAGLRFQRRRLHSAAVVAAVVLAPWAAAGVPLPAAGQSESGPDTAVVAVVQGDVPNTGLGFADRSSRRAVLDNHVAQTLALARAVAAGETQQPDAVIWPENASDLDPYTAADARAAIDAAARAIGAPILVGAVITNPEDPATVRNVGIVWDPADGPGAVYVKQHPVPFGEYVPARPLLTRLIGRFELVPRDFVAGEEPGVLDVGPVRLGAVICFEVAYDDLVRDTVLAGARMLAVQTNNATYTGTGQSEQQLAMARLRAVEQGRSVAVAATNGISALYLPDGTLAGRLDERTAGWLVARLPLRDTPSLAARLGWAPEALAVAATALACLAGSRRRPVRRGDIVGSRQHPRRVGQSPHA